MKPYMTVPEVAELLGCNHKTVYSEIESGRLGCVRIGPARRTIRVPAAALSAWESDQLGTGGTVPNLSFTARQA